MPRWRRIRKKGLILFPVLSMYGEFPHSSVMSGVSTPAGLPTRPVFLLCHTTMVLGSPISDSRAGILLAPPHNS